MHHSQFHLTGVNGTSLGISLNSFKLIPTLQGQYSKTSLFSQENIIDIFAELCYSLFCKDILNFRKEGKAVDTTAIKDVAIEKLIELSKEEVAKVLIFMAGLDAGMQIGDKQPIKRDEII